VCVCVNLEFFLVKTCKVFFFLFQVFRCHELFDLGLLGVGWHLSLSKVAPCTQPGYDDGVCSLLSVARRS
jgi:hypothetical protein